MSMPSAPPRPFHRDATALIRRFLLGLLTLGLVGLGFELIALGHYEDSWQLVPVGLIALALLAVTWYVAGGGAASIRLLQLTMGLFVMAGAIGIWLHYRGNLQFHLEMDPTQSHWELFKKVLHAKAPPALAPGSMTQLGLLGLVFAFRHPALTKGPES